MHVRALPLLCALAVSWMSGGARADACSCVDFSKSRLATESEAVFTGRAIGQVGIVPGTMRFHVVLAYKGAVARSAQVQVGTGGGAACASEFTPGIRYTVFARDYDGDGLLNTNACFRPVSGDIDPADYGLTAARSVPGSGLGDLVVALGGVLLLALAAMLVANRAHGKGGSAVLPAT